MVVMTDLIDHIGIWAFNLDGMRGKLGIQVAGLHQVSRHELRVELPFREYSGYR